eukprot:144478-Rhodomonas_salina.1
MSKPKDTNANKDAKRGRNERKQQRAAKDTAPEDACCTRSLCVNNENTSARHYALCCTNNERTAAAGSGFDLCEMTVHIPLHVLDVGAREQSLRPHTLRQPPRVAEHGRTGRATSEQTEQERVGR